jgi:hypothetical protein
VAAANQLSNLALLSAVVQAEQDVAAAAVALRNAEFTLSAEELLYDDIVATGNETAIEQEEVVLFQDVNAVIRAEQVLAAAQKVLNAASNALCGLK